MGGHPLTLMQYTLLCCETIPLMVVHACRMTKCIIYRVPMQTIPQQGFLAVQLPDLLS